MKQGNSLETTHCSLKDEGVEKLAIVHIIPPLESQRKEVVASLCSILLDMALKINCGKSVRLTFVFKFHTPLPMQ